MRAAPSERARVVVCSGLGIVALAIALVLAPWELAILIGWVVTAVPLVAGIWLEIGRLDATATQRVATREDDSRAAMLLLLVGASLVSLVAVVLGLHRATTASRQLEIALSVSALVTVVLSWLLVHTLFTLRYAHLYYGVDGVGGVDFPGGEPSRYADFAYLAFTIGMTYQVSDTSITGSAIRRTLTRHALLSYLFGTAIIASSISVLAGLVV